ncbi:MAG: hypothetical protein U9O98_10955 [Asgard group archaeon]|nr:hypothetical protein [Asgard group archaeon]
MRRKNTEIMDSIEKNQKITFTSQTFSRYLKRIKRYCLNGTRVFLNPFIFDLYTTVLIIGEANEKTIRNIRSLIIESPIPFSSTFKSTRRELFWYLRIPPRNLVDLLHHLHKRLDQLNFYYIDYV